MISRIKQTFRSDSPFAVFLLCMLVAGCGYGVYNGILDNYLADIVGMGQFERGVAEFFRELPGFLLVLFLAVFYMFSAETLFKAGAVAALLGMFLIGVLPASRFWVTLAIFIYSFGEHVQLGMRTTMCLQYAREGQGGTSLGYQNSLYQIGTLAGYAIIIFVFSLFAADKPYRAFFLFAACFSCAAMVLSLRIRGSSAVDPSKSRFYFHKKYTKYYMLEIFYGARKQVFFTFGPYVLILFYGANATVISILFAVSAIACFFLSPVVGRIVDKLGYKIVMISDTLILVIVCFFYGFAHRIFPMNVAYIVCCINYVLDAVISLAAMASNVYVQDLSDSADETRATLSTGISVNHLITLFIALFGGWVWQTLGMETLFILSAVLGLCNSAYAATIQVPAKKA